MVGGLFAVTGGWSVPLLLLPGRIR
ncbi:protein of unknown function [Blastococcus saxobsidens DD2]|uniref:Uncharacterized protein n=1 Tax=Blastococcus saxobsidens (strain DD2) TaxID=1146883 RepID=H6RX10_BLASD|nr:protein of unknown function [Blastococcus saxobsidens DD2]